MVDSAHLITKVYFPRLIIPLSAALAGLVDFGVGFGLLAVLMAVYEVQLSLRALTLPLFLLLAMATALGFGLWLCGAQRAISGREAPGPFVVQTWMYVTPVVYGSQLVPERYRWLVGAEPDDRGGGGLSLGAFGRRSARSPECRLPSCCSQSLS